MNAKNALAGIALLGIGVGAGAVLKSTQAARDPIDLMDEKHPMAASNAQWRNDVRNFCDAAARVIDLQNTIHAAAVQDGLTMTGRGRYVIARQTSAGTINVPLDLTVPASPDGGTP